MKQFLHSTVFLFSIFNIGFTQNLEMTLSPGEGPSTGDIILNVSENEWLVGGSFSVPGVTSWTSPFLYKINSENELIWQFEDFNIGINHRISGLGIMPNGDFIVAVDNLIECDIIDVANIYRIGADGQQVWKTNAEVLYVNNLSITNEGRIFHRGEFLNGIIEVDASTGITISLLTQLNDFRAFLALENEEFIFAKKEGILTKTDIDGNILTNFEFSINHNNYQLNRITDSTFTVFSENQYYIFDNDLNLLQFFDLSDYSVIFKVLNGGNENWIYRRDAENDQYLVKLDSAFNFIDEIKIYEWKGQNSPKSAAIDEDEIVVTGHTNWAYYEDVNRSGNPITRSFGQDVFVKSYSKEDFLTTDYQTDIGISNIQLAWDFGLDTTMDWCTGELSASLLLANITLDLTNHGAEILDDISIKTNFSSCHDFCNVDQHFRQDYMDLNLESGASLELVFNNFFVELQPLAGPIELCFWISLPNSKLDEQFENNHTCHKIISSIRDVPLNQDLAIYPNPAQNMIQIELPKTNFEPSNIRIFDSLGKVVYEDEKQNLNEVIELNINELTKGAYILNIQTKEEIFVSKFVKM